MSDTGGQLGPDAQPNPPAAAAKPLGVSTPVPPAPPPAPPIPAPADPSIEACKRDRMKMTLSLAAMGYLSLVTLIYGYCLIRGVKIDGEAAASMNIIAGGALGFVKDAYSFVFGSSQGSEDKTTALTAAAIATPVPAKAP